MVGLYLDDFTCLDLVKYSLYPFEALAEIFDFLAGLVQRVPKKPSIVKADLQNSTASQGDCNWENFVAFGCGSKMLPLQSPQPGHPERRRAPSESKDLYKDNLKEDSHPERK